MATGGTSACSASGGASPYTVIVRYAARTLASMGESIDPLVAHDGDSEHTKCTKERAAPMVRISFGQPCGVAATYVSRASVRGRARCIRFTRDGGMARRIRSSVGMSSRRT